MYNYKQVSQKTDYLSLLVGEIILMVKDEIQELIEYISQNLCQVDN
jgi:hypothetical protein